MSTEPAEGPAPRAVHRSEPGALSQLTDWAYSWRDRLVGNERFQRWARQFWLTRPVARAQEKALFDLCAGFVYSQVLLACVRLNLLQVVRSGPLPFAHIAAAIDLSREQTERLLSAASALDLVSARSGGRYGLGMRGAALLANPGVLALVAHHDLLYRDLADPVDLLRRSDRSTLLADYWPYAAAGQQSSGLTPEQVGAYTSLMARSQSMISADLVEAYDFRRHQRLLDIGGGDGSFILAVARAYPHISGAILDLPAVTALADARISEANAMGRISTIGGSFFDPPALPADIDAVSLVRVLLDHDDHDATRILKTARSALPAGGTLLIAEAISDHPQSRRVADTYFNFYLMAMGRGRPRSLSQFKTLGARAGFTDFKVIPTPRPMITSLIRARAA